ncbi:MAG: peptide ABC transporter substrate-binding protein [Dehalococcoidia bacterium]|nr:peptide ABC transporter substrate-binding protein [Dehalococcoidia bacterium]
MKLVRLIAAFMVAGASMGCNPWAVKPPPTGGTLTIRLKSDVPLLNPLVNDLPSRRVMGLMFAGLTRLDAGLRVQPDLAKSWELSSSGLVWTFHLRDNLRWHDGTPLTIEDVAHTYRYLMQGEPATIVQSDLLNVVEAIEIVDKQSIRFTLRRAFSPLFVDTTTPIVPKHIWNELANPGRATVVVGSGPFKLAEHVPGQAIMLDANPEYYGGRPYLDRVAIMFGGESATMQAIDSGQLLLAEVDVGSVPGLPVSYGRHSYSEIGYNYVGFNLREGRLMADRNLRLAWSMAVDKQNIVAAATGGKGQEIWGPVTPGSWADDYSLSPTIRNVEAARKLMDDSGWRDSNGDGVADKDGRPLSVELLVRADARDRVTAAQLMAKQLREAGFDVRVTPADFSTVMAARRKPPFDFDAMIMGWELGMDPDSYYLFASAQIPAEGKTGLLNYVGFKNGEYDRLAIEARTTMDYGRRKDLYARIQALLADELPYYFLWSEQTHLAASPRLQGPISLDSPMFLWNVEKWYFDGPTRSL